MKVSGVETLGVKQVALPSAPLGSSGTWNDPLNAPWTPQAVLGAGEYRERSGRARLGGTFSPWSLALDGVDG